MISTKMKAILCAAMVSTWVAILLFIMDKVDVPIKAPIDRNPDLWMRGRITYRTRCVSCHNVDPDKPGSVGPALRGITEKRLTDVLVNGRGAMPPQKIKPERVKALAEYLR